MLKFLETFEIKISPNALGDINQIIPKREASKVLVEPLPGKPLGIIPQVDMGPKGRWTHRQPISNSTRLRSVKNYCR